MESEGVKKNQSLRKAISILEEMTKLEGPARLQDIAESVQMSPSTVLRFLNTYIDYGYVRQEPNTNFYYLTLKLAELGARTRAHFPFQQILSKYVREISRTFNESSSLCIESDMQMVYIATEDGPGHTLQTLQRIGRIAPMHATGVGKLHLLNYTHKQLLELEEKRGLPKLTVNTRSTLPELQEELNIIRKQGYALDEEECETGVRCIAVPVLDYTGKIVAGISLSAPISRLNSEKTQSIIDYLRGVGKRASCDMGWCQTPPINFTK